MGHGLSSFSVRAIWVRDAFEAYFSVHNWTRMPICLRSLCSWRTLRVGSGVSKYCSAFRFVLPAGFPVFLGFGSCPRLVHLFRAALSEYSSAGRSALRPFEPSLLHPVASLAAVSAISFPRMPLWAGIRRISIAKLAVRRSWVCRTISWT